MLWSLILSGTIGHVAHGKSTVVKAISGVQVCTHYSFPVILFLVANFYLFHGRVCFLDLLIKSNSCPVFSCLV